MNTGDAEDYKMSAEEMDYHIIGGSISLTVQFEGGPKEVQQARREIQCEETDSFP